MARVIVRFSLNDDASSRVRNLVRDQLQAAGIANTGTGTWEADGPDLDDIVRAIARAMGTLAEPQLATGTATAAKLDHLWVYIDQV